MEVEKWKNLIHKLLKRYKNVKYNPHQLELQEKPNLSEKRFAYFFLDWDTF